MDGVSHYVTVRRDLYTGLVASPATTLPVATLAITETNNPVTEDNADTLSSSGGSVEQQQQQHHHHHPGSTHHHTLAVATTNTNLTENNSGIHYDCNLCAKTYPSKALLTRHLRNQHQLLINPAAAGVTVTNSSCTTAGSCNNTTTAATKTPSPPLNSEFKSTSKHLKPLHQHEVIVTTAATSNERSSPILSSAAVSNDIQQTRGGGGGVGGGIGSDSGKRQPGEKRFQCGQCFKRFPTSKDLKRHDVVHTGNREFQCSFCSHRFGRKDHRMRHEKKTHANELLNGSSGSPISPKADSNCSSSSNNTPVFGNKHHRSCVTASEELPRPGGGGVVHGSNAGSSSPIEKKRWRHVSSPSITSSDLDLDQFDSPIRLRAMSTSEPYHYREPRCNSVTGSDLKYLENQLSPESLQESHSMSPDLNSVKEESEDTCLSHGSEDTCKSDLDWIMSDFCMTAAAGSGRTGNDNTKVVESVLSPSPDSSSGLSPPVGFYAAPAPPPTPTPIIIAPSENPRPNSSAEKLLVVESSSTTAAQQPLPTPTSTAAATPTPPLPTMPSLIPMTRCPKQLMSDMLTRTKNPVLPSVYIDNSLIVPEPSKQKYHNPHPLLSPEDMDDYYEAFLDDKDITETLFHV